MIHNIAREVNMIYLIGGVARAGKSILCQQFAAELKIGWISTDLMMELLRVSNVPGIKREWNASSKAIKTNAEWFFPYLEKFIWGVNSLAENYVIEGVDFLPAQISQLSRQYPIRSLFLGCSQMTLEAFDQYPGHSRGYSHLPDEVKRQIVHDVPLWSEVIRQEAKRFSLPYLDTSYDFAQRIKEALTILLA